MILGLQFSISFLRYFANSKASSFIMVSRVCFLLDYVGSVVGRAGFEPATVRFLYA